MKIETFRELFAFNTWANELVLGLTEKLSDEKLDRPFEMGFGSLRETLKHIYGADRVWYERVDGPGYATLPASSPLRGIGEIRDAADQLDRGRASWLDTVASSDLDRTIHFHDREGRPFERRLGDILLHVCNHGVHHRAQAVNMLRRLGEPVPKPGADYIFMKWAQEGEIAAALDVATLRRFFAYSDASHRTLHAIAETLSDNDLDRPFEIGLGTIRRTLAHFYDAEWWWHQNWTRGPGTPFPKTDEKVAVAGLRGQFDEFATARNAMLGTMTDADLNRPVEVLPRPDLRRVFPIGVSMLQLCTHATHHRAQANNMLRHLGREPIRLDYILWCGESTRSRS